MGFVDRSGVQRTETARAAADSGCTRKSIRVSAGNSIVAMTHQLHSNDVRLGQTSYKFQSYPSNTNSFKWLVKGVKCKTRAHGDGFQKKKKWVRQLT